MLFMLVFHSRDCEMDPPRLRRFDLGVALRLDGMTARCPSEQSHHEDSPPSFANVGSPLKGLKRGDLNHPVSYTLVAILHLFGYPDLVGISSGPLMKPRP